jgi:hypothetical protein
MRKTLFCILLVLVEALPSVACEICGCANSNFQIGLLPSFNKGFIGVRYTSSEFSSQLSTDPSQYSHDSYRGIDLWGGYNFNKLQVMGFIPYLFNRKVSDDGTTKSTGMGDALILVNYKIVASAYLNKSETGSVRHEVFVGGGIKLPTGIARVDTSNPEFNIGDFNSQAGTGSTDFLFTITHNLMWSRSGVVTNYSYRLNTTNKQDYRFGNRMYFNSAYFYSIKTGPFSIKPNAGINCQTNQVNTYSGTAIEGSDGYILSAIVGANLLYGKMGFNASGFLPFVQNNYNGQTKMDSKIMLGVTYSF